nr:hypothetical protein [Tanacetum cinerariifolium]
MMVQAQVEMGEEHVADEAVRKEMDDSLERVATTATSLDAEQDKGNIFKTQSKATHSEPGSQGTSLSGGPRCQETMRDTVAQTRVLDLETTKTTQALEIDSLKRRVKKLERRKRWYEVIVKNVDVAEQAKEVVDDITLAKALMEIKSEKSKAVKVVIQEPE